MHIVLVNWAKLPDGPLEGGGVNGYCQQLALELIARGHDVSYLSSGISYTPGPHGGIGACEVRRLEDYRGIRVFDVVNSPVVAPGPCQARDPDAETASPALEAEVGRFMSLVNADVVHVHNIEGLSAGCLEACRAGGASVLFSLHNYHTVCPQVYLMQRGRRPCWSFDSGRACVGCADVCEPADERRHRARLYAERFGPVEPQAVALPPPAPPARGILATVFGRTATPSPAASPAPKREIPMPGRPTDGADAIRTRVPSSTDVAEPVFALNPNDPDWAPLSNEAVPDPSEPGVETPYGRRRGAMIRALAACDRVLAVSDFVNRKFAALGVPRRVLQTMHIGTRMTELAGPRARTMSPRGANTPVRVVFLGYHNHFKGLHCLADAMELLPAEVLAKIDLFVSAKAVEPFEWRLRRLRPRLANLAVEHGYRYAEIPDLCRGRDVGIVPSVWWDNGPQTVLEFFACGLPVVGADLGGIPDWVRHEHNGLLYPGNDRHALARAITRLAVEPDLVERLRANVAPPKGMGAHAAEMEALYASLRRRE